MSRIWRTPLPTMYRTARPQEGAVRLHGDPHLGRLGGEFVAGPLVHLVVVLAAQQVVVDPCRVRPAGVDLLGGEAVLNHVALLSSTATTGTDPSPAHG
jgi:hypothetical protein